MSAQSLFLFLIFFAGIAQAQNWEEEAKGALTVKWGVSSPSYQMKINDEELVGKDISYFPSNRGKVFLNFSYNIFSLTVSTVGPTLPEDDRLYGRTNSSDFQFRISGHKLSYDFFYQKYKGYYLENTKTFVPGFKDTDPRIQRPDIKNEHYAANLIYTLNPVDFSMSTLFDQDGHQRTSGGSWLSMGSIDYNRILANESLVPTQIAGTYGEFEKVNGNRVLTASAGFGYGFNLVYDHWFVGGVFIASFGIQDQKTEFISESSESIKKGISRSLVRLALGYNGEKFISGVNINVDNNNNIIKNAKLSLNTIDTYIYFGYRFADVNWTWIDELSDKIF